MKIGLIIAIERELKAFLENGTEIKQEIVNNRMIYMTSINGHEIFAMRSGCGIIDAASATQLLITLYGVELVLNFGVAGALDRTLKVEDLFVVKNVLHYEYDVSPIDPVKKYQYEEFQDEFIPLDRDFIKLAKEVNPSLKEAVVASGGRFIVDKERKLKHFEKGCHICDMEIAAIARTCFLAGIPCLSIKCISDTFDGDGGDFNTNVEKSAIAAFKVIVDILNKIQR